MAVASSSARLEVECLESRRLMSVRVFVSNGDLFVVGNGEDDNILIQQVGVREYLVVGIGTDIVGDADDEVTVRVRDDFKISLNGGFDTITLDGTNSVNGRLRVPDELFINTGTDGDLVELFDVHVPDDVSINTGSGSDQVSIFDSHFGDDSDVSIKTGADEDFVDLEGNFFGDEVDVYLGFGDDTMFACDNVFTDETRFYGGPDFDELFHLNDYQDDFRRSGFEFVDICD